ncbi:response regulator [Bermanella sp. WJH001]|uniref:response regulator n=1 Tax=Bermanella sp. WJH001 TaxID=3048005 RepID=UPI0024BE23A6|nr:response regulator [Bermanella sp. WJH001]MDJ1537501.1 response regulator [Bermanella sp. WJH001]
MRILLIEDDLQLASGLKQSLNAEQYTIDHFDQVKVALNAVNQEHYDLVILDLGLPDADGFTFLQGYRKNHTSPVLILTARDNIDDKIKGLDLGADDYLTKPFDVSELQARIRALLRRSAGRANNLILYQNLILNQQSRSVLLDDAPVTLSRREYNLLEVLLENEGRVMSRVSLEQTLYSWDDEIESNALEVHIHNLRKKLFSALIKTVRGVGYMVPKNE